MELTHRVITWLKLRPASAVRPEGATGPGEACPEFPHHPQRAHWSIPDPAAADDDDQVSYPAFQRTAADIDTRIRHLLPVLTATDRSEVPS
jgi:hypothetical protein